MADHHEAEQRDNAALLNSLKEVERNVEHIFVSLGIHSNQILAAIRALKNVGSFCDSYRSCAEC